MVCMGSSCPKKKGIAPMPVIPIRPIPIEQLGGVRSNIIVRTNIDVIASDGSTVTIPLVTTNEPPKANSGPKKGQVNKSSETLHAIIPEKPKTQETVIVKENPQTVPEKPKEKGFFEKYWKLIIYYVIVGLSLTGVSVRYRDKIKAFLRLG
jgi:hypothetical protein